jgi:ATP-dependent Clp protease ATP-binding subunit ClpB
VGFEEGGQLTEAVRRRPYSVVLLDEIEKAHVEVFYVFLQVLDEGRLTDGHGRTVDFRNAVVIMTSNIGSQFIMDIDDESEMRRRVMGSQTFHFPPEFLNRVDDIVIFHRLTREHLREITKIQLERLSIRLAHKSITLSLTQSATDQLIEQGYDPAFGARPLKRVLQNRIVDDMAVRMLQDEIRRGDHVVVDAINGQLTFTVAEPAGTGEELIGESV